MEKSLFIGIDFSKKTFDVSLIDGNNLNGIPGYKQFDNTKEGCNQLLKWVKLWSKIPVSEWLFCGEHTGLYSVLLSEFLIKKNLFVWLENPLQIKLSTGIKRDKNDKVDSREIALYALRFQDKAKESQLSDKSLKSLELLLGFRDRLIGNKHALLVSAAELRDVLNRDVTARYIYEQSQKDIERINKEIKCVEAKMKEVVDSNDAIKETYEVVSSIKGVALINTVAIIVATKNFSRFENSRQFACYAGMAPFGKQSGTSIKTGPHVSHLANKRIKTLLTQAAQCAIRHNSDLKQYYTRKVAEGKNKWIVLNNVRNKLIHCIFALVRDKQLYQEGFLQHMEKSIA